MLEFRDDTTGFLVSNGIVYRTTNGGLRWANVGGGYVGAIQFAGRDTGWTFGAGYLARTGDNGNTWQNFGKTIAGSDAQCIYFADPLRGYMMGIARPWPPNLSRSAAEWFKTVDGGQTWSGYYAGTSQDLQGKIHWGIPGDVFDIAAFGADTVISVGSQIGRTTDGGRDWDTIAYPSSCLLQGIDFPDHDNGTAVGSRDVIVHTSDGGNTWVLQNSGITDGTYLYAVRFVDSILGYVVGEDGIILKTGNGGLSWVRVLRGLDSIQLSVYPNPAGSQTSIAYDLPEAQHVTLAVLDLSGNVVMHILRGVLQPAGTHRFIIDEGNLSCGTYFFRIRTEKYFGIIKFQVVCN